MPPSPHLLRLVPRAPNRLSPLASRTFHQSARPLSNKDAESADDKDTLTPERAEYTRSGTDAGVAQNKVSSFDPKLIRPDEEREMCGKGNEAKNPLEWSPANTEISKQRNEAEDGAGSGPEHLPSRQGHPKKGKKVT